MILFLIPILVLFYRYRAFFILFRFKITFNIYFKALIYKYI